MISRYRALAAMLFAIAGCAENYEKASMTGAKAASAEAPATPRSSSDAYFSEVTKGGSEIVQVAGGGAPNAQDAPKPTPRKIIYIADVALVVEDFPKTTTSIAALVSQYGGYVADTDIAGSSGNNRRATWKVRLPVERFDSFLDAVVKLGELERRKVNSQDVTEEFFDLETRIKNKKVEEGRLVKHLTDSTGKLKEILDVEKEISRVREEVERMEGRVRLLANLADLTTVSITVEERIGYVPATAPTFGTRIRRTFESSTKGLMIFLEGLSLAVISVIPWLPVWLVLGGLAWLFVRTLRRWYVSSPTPPRPSSP